MLLLDTHAWLWLIEDSPRAGRRAKAAFRRETISGTVLVAAISLWEVAWLAQADRLRLRRDASEWLPDALSRPGIAVAPLTVEVAIAASGMQLGTADPADRLIAATARVAGATLVTADTRLLDYAAAGHLKALDARS